MFYRTVESILTDMKIGHPCFTPVYDQILRAHIRELNKNEIVCSTNIIDEIRSIQEEIYSITKSLKKLKNKLEN